MKGAASAVGDDVTAWYCHGLETRLKAAPGPRGDDSLPDWAHHRAVIAQLLDQPEAALATLRAVSEPPVAADAVQERLQQSELVPPGASEESGPHPLLRIPPDAVDRLLELLERVYLAHDELRGTGHAARRLAWELREQRSGLLEAQRAIGSARGWGVPPATLAQVQSVLQGIAEAAEDADRIALMCRRNASALQTRTAQMRAEVAALRRTTVRWLFDRVGFAVERLAADGSYHVRTVTSGSDLAIDRRVAERLLEPVLQLARNAVAHGIEPPAKRALAGKSPTGTISLRAEQLGDWLRIVVEDDGGGVDLARVRQLAVQRGAASAEAMEAMVWMAENEVYGIDKK
jgi:two-component system chemotaxis sensor kinase CheA